MPSLHRNNQYSKTHPSQDPPKFSIFALWLKVKIFKCHNFLTITLFVTYFVIYFVIIFVTDIFSWHIFSLQILRFPSYFHVYFYFCVFNIFVRGFVQNISLWSTQPLFFLDFQLNFWLLRYSTFTVRIMSKTLRTNTIRTSQSWSYEPYSKRRKIFLPLNTRFSTDPCFTFLGNILLPGILNLIRTHSEEPLLSVHDRHLAR